MGSPYIFPNVMGKGLTIWGGMSASTIMLECNEINIG
jgi:hypothetical protein